MNRAIRLTNLDDAACQPERVSADGHGPIRVELEVGRSVLITFLGKAEARELARALLRITGNVVEPLDDGDEMEDVEPPPGG